MSFRHSKREPEERGHSPGNGITDIPLSQAPMATEGEATPGPDDQNPYDEREFEQAKRGHDGASMPDFDTESPTHGRDPFVFDDAGAALPDLELPGERTPNTDIELPGDF